MSDQDAPPVERCGYVAFVGRPNVGKSTLLNALLGQKLSITSSRPQTTRHVLLGIRTDEADQMVFVDTPGLHSGEKRALNRAMNRAARSVFLDVDVVCMLVEAQRWTPEDERVLAMLEPVRGRRILVINKTDRVRPKERLLPFMQQCAERGGFDEIVPLSALKEDNVEALLGCLRGLCRRRRISSGQMSSRIAANAFSLPSSCARNSRGALATSCPTNWRYRWSAGKKPRPSWSFTCRFSSNAMVSVRS